MTELIKVASTSPTTAVAGAIAGVVRSSGKASVQAIGASAVHQAVKSVAIARIYLQEDGIELTCVPMFVDVMVGGNERTAVRIEVTGHGAPLIRPADDPADGPDDIDSSAENDVADAAADGAADDAHESPADHDQ